MHMMAAEVAASEPAAGAAPAAAGTATMLRPPTHTHTPHPHTHLYTHTPTHPHTNPAHIVSLGSVVGVTGGVQMNAGSTEFPSYEII